MLSLVIRNAIASGVSKDFFNEGRNREAERQIALQMQGNPPIPPQASAALPEALAGKRPRKVDLRSPFRCPRCHSLRRVHSASRHFTQLASLFTSASAGHRTCQPLTGAPNGSVLPAMDGGNKTRAVEGIHSRTQNYGIRPGDGSIGKEKPDCVSAFYLDAICQGPDLPRINLGLVGPS